MPLILLLMLTLTGAASAQVATLATPDSEAAATEAPLEEIDGEQAILEFVACLRENGLDIPDPQFGPEGPRFADPSVMASIDFGGDAFVNAMDACGDLLATLQPEIDPEQQAEQIEQQLAMAECMRREGIDFPDPDPVRGFRIGSMRIDPFSPEFRAAFEVCAPEIGFDATGPAGAP